MSSPKQQFGGSHNGNHNNTIATASGVAMNKNKPKVTPHKKNATASKIGVKKKVKDDIEVLKDTKDEKIYELETNVIESLGDLRMISTDLHADLNNEVFKLKKRFENEYKDILSFFDVLIEEITKVKDSISTRLFGIHSKVLDGTSVQMNKFEDNYDILDKVLDCINQNEKKVTDEDYDALKYILEDLKVNMTDKEHYEKLEYFDFESVLENSRSILSNSFAFVSTNRDLKKVMMFNSEVQNLLTRLLSQSGPDYKKVSFHGRQQSETLNYDFGTSEKLFNKNSTDYDWLKTKPKFFNSREIDFDYESEVLSKREESGNELNFNLENSNPNQIVSAFNVLSDGQQIHQLSPQVKDQNQKLHTSPKTAENPFGFQYNQNQEPKQNDIRHNYKQSNGGSEDFCCIQDWNRFERNTDDDISLKNLNIHTNNKPIELVAEDNGKSDDLSENSPDKKIFIETKKNYYYHNKKYNNDCDGNNDDMSTGFKKKKNIYAINSNFCSDGDKSESSDADINDLNDEFERGKINDNLFEGLNLCCSEKLNPVLGTPDFNDYLGSKN